MSIPYYGTKVDESIFTGRLGAVVRGLNRTRLFFQRATEVTAVVHQAIERELELGPIVDRLFEEGFAQPYEILTKPPVDIVGQPDTPGITGRFYAQRDYSARVGRSRDQEVRDKQAGIREDKTLSLVKRYASQRTRAGRYGAHPLVREVFEPVSKKRTA